MSDRLYLRGSVWWARVRGPDGRIIRVSTKCTDRRAASRVAIELERHGAAGNPAPTTTIETALMHTLEDRRARGRSAATLGYYAEKGGHFLRVWGRDRDLARVTPALVDAYISQRTEEGVTRHTIGKELGVLRTTLRLAARRGEFPRDPKTVLPIGWSSNYTPRKAWATAEGLSRLLGALPSDRAAHVAWIVATGSRWGESLRAQRSDVGPASITIRGTKTKASARAIPRIAALDALVERALRDAPGKERLFRPWSNVRRDLTAACAQAKVETWTPNDLRRTTGQWLRRSGVAPGIIGSYLGHVDSRMVERVYGQLDAEGTGALLENVPILYRDSVDSMDSMDAVDVPPPLPVPQNSGDSSQSSVARAGIEPATRGFSIRGELDDSSGNLPVSGATVPDLYADPVSRAKVFARVLGLLRRVVLEGNPANAQAVLGLALELRRAA